MYSIYLSNQAKKFLSTCDDKIRMHLDELFDVLIEDPLPLHNYDIAKIKGLEKTYRIRLGTIRVIIELIPKTNDIHILKIDKRSKIYRNI